MRIVQNSGSARSRARLAATSTRFAKAVDASWNCLTVCSPREAPLAWTVRLLREKELAFLEELTVHVRPRWSLTSNEVSQRGLLCLVSSFDLLAVLLDRSSFEWAVCFSP